MGSLSTSTPTSSRLFGQVYQIFEVADQLAAAGQTPTLANVRKALGGGSYTTISEAMTEWKAVRQVSTAPFREPAPPAISERMAELGADVWAIALELAGGRLKADREALEGARVEMEAQKAEAVELADQMAAEIEQLRGRCAELEERARAECEGADEVRRQLSAALERAQAAEVRAGELADRAADLNKEPALGVGRWVPAGGAGVWDSAWRWVPGQIALPV